MVGIRYTYGLALMLIAMTYNLGLLIALGFGYFVGTFIIGGSLEALDIGSSDCH